MDEPETHPKSSDEGDIARHPNPSTSKQTSRGGSCRGRGVKVPSAGGPHTLHPHPHPSKTLGGQGNGAGGGGRKWGIDSFVLGAHPPHSRTADARDGAGCHPAQVVYGELCTQRGRVGSEADAWKCCKRGDICIAT